MTDRRKTINPAWVAISVTLTVVVVGWVSSFAVNSYKVDTIKKDFGQHCAENVQDKTRVDDKLEKILASLARVETKLEYLEKKR